MTPAFDVVEYSFETFVNLLARKVGVSVSKVRDKPHSAYFESYFAELGAKTILCENTYIDHDYLEDYAGYYVRCFYNYDRFCIRLHFFDIHFSYDDFCALLERRDSPVSYGNFQDAYLGFIVVKPLPETIIGRTCLKTYPTINRIRNYPITQHYSVNIFGLDFTVETIAFQEQDKVASACATSALWSVFHGTGKIFQHSILSPLEITKAATQDLPSENRTLPSKGLNAAHMCHVIRKLNLEPLFVNVQKEYILRSTIYAYLKGKLPMILAV